MLNGVSDCKIEKPLYLRLMRSLDYLKIQINLMKKTGRIKNRLDGDLEVLNQINLTIV